MDPYISIGNVLRQSHLPHPTPSATFIDGPIRNLHHFTEWVHVGFPELLDKFAHGLFRVHRQFSVSLCGSLKFGTTESFWVNGELTADILCTLSPANKGNTTMLPSLRQVHLQKPTAMDGLWESVQSFITARWISGRPVEVNAPSYQCHICHVSFKEQYGLKGHLRDEHRYQVLCSYCRDFECTSHQGPIDLFREHLEGKHPEIVRNDALIWNSFSLLQPDILVNRHSSLRAPAIIALSPMSTEPRDTISRDLDFDDSDYNAPDFRFPGHFYLEN